MSGLWVCLRKGSVGVWVSLDMLEAKAAGLRVNGFGFRV